MNSILQTLNQLGKDLLDMELAGNTIGAFLQECRSLADEAILELAQYRIQEIDQVLSEKTFDRNDWIIVKKDVPRTLETNLGVLRYDRRYYRDRQTKEYCYLTDVMIGVRKYQRVEDELALSLIEASSTMSYRQASAKVCEGRLSATSVMNSIRQIDIPDPVESQPKRAVKELHIQADEDHVHLQKQHRKSGQIRFAAIHEPKVKVGKNRYRLPKRHILSSVNERPEAFGERVLDTLDAMYDLNEVETIYCHGDGASWIQTLSELLPKSLSVLDHFHLEKELLGVCRGDRRLRSRLRKKLHPWDGKGLDEELQMLVDSDVCTEEKARKLRVYLRNNRQAIINHFSLPHGGSCAEGLVSHVFSKRFSRDPMSWSVASLRKLSQVRAHLENGKTLDKTMLWKSTETDEPMNILGDKVRLSVRASKRPSVPDWSANIPGSEHKSGALGAIMRSINNRGFLC